MANLGNFRAYANADCKGDKIKLPQSASQRLLSIPHISYPLCFELSVPISREEVLNAMQNGLSKPERQCIHCGVLDFTASEGCICLPSWIIDNLSISESSMLTVTNITLPKGRYVRLQPHTLLKDIKTKQKLESSLRNFTTLTANTTITIAAMNNLQLNVLEVKPNKNKLNSIQIIDCDLVVEFEAALDGTTTDIQHFERNLILNTDNKEDIITDKVNVGEYRFYKLELMTQDIDSIKIKAIPQQNDIDLYASWTHNEPGTTSTNYDYHCIEHGAVEIIVNIAADNTSPYLYITVHGFDGSTEHKEKDNTIEYTLSVSNISLSGTELKELYRASSLVQHECENKTEDVPINDDPNKSFCSNCHRFVNKWSYDRHYTHCIKQFDYCVSCKKVIKMDDIIAHNKTFHNDLKCKMCGEMISGGKQTLISHQKHECLNRPINCEYCHLPFPFIEYEQHQIICGFRTEICVYCNQYIELSSIQQHTIDVHGRDYESPMGMPRIKSVDENDIKLGGFASPQRNYDTMNDADNDNVKRTRHERWICSSCDYNNRPNHIQCKICKTKRTKYMKTVSEVEDASNIRPQNVKQMDKIGGNMQNIPQRNYNDMLSNKKEKEYVIKPQLKEKKKEDIVVASAIDPSMIPQRDYHKMLNETETDVNMHDVADPNIADDDDDPNIELSTNIDNIPHRDYEQMLNQREIEYDEAMEPSNDDKKTNTNQYRSETAVIPQRNYNEMIKKNDNDITMNDTTMNDNTNTDSQTKSGYWLCPSSECEHLNRATRNNCSVCHTLKAAYRRTAHLLDDSVDELGLDHRWVCKNCDGLNKGSRNKCVYCKEIKSYEPNSKKTAHKVIESTKKKKREHGIFDDAERWVCHNKDCNFLNKGSRLKCQVCHCERADQHILWGDRAKDSNTNKKKTDEHPLEPQHIDNIADASSKWSCPICTFLNTQSRCEMCGCPKDAQ